VEYSANAFATIADDGTVTSADRSPLMRADYKDGAFPLGETPAVRRFWELALPAVAAWAKTEPGQEILAAGDYASVHNDLEYVEATIAEAEAKLVALRARALELKTRREQLARDGKEEDQ
jgi:hypothetical protein